MKRRSIEELNLMDDFLFQSVISRGREGEEVCRILLNTILGGNITKVRVIPQKAVLAGDTTRHGIRMDAYVEDISDALTGAEAEAEVEPDIYDLEPDQKYEKETLPRRSRYYHAVIDTRVLDAGKNYRQLRRVVIIMILPYDPFDKNRMIYTVRNSCVEDPSVPYDDGMEKIFLYTKGNADSAGQSLKEMLEYMQESNEMHVTNQDIETIHSIVSKVRRDKEVGISYMKSWEYEEMIREEATREGLETGRKRGLEQGRGDGVRESIRSLLMELGDIPQEVEQQLQQEKDVERLKQLVLAAARAESVEQFAKAL